MSVVCPKCGFNSDNETDCLKCGINFKSYARLKEQQQVPGLGNSPDSGLELGASAAAVAVTEAEAVPQAERWDRVSFDNFHARLLAFPAAIVFAFLLLSIDSDVLIFIPEAWIHEFGHATVDWLGGYPALPLFAVTVRLEDRSILIYVCFFFLFSALFYTAWKEKLNGLMVIAAALILVQAKLTWFTSPFKLDEWIVFGGCAGEIWISTLLMLAFYIRMPDRWRWDFWRFVVLVIATVTFFHVYRFWHDVRWGREAIPWGSAINGADDNNGDMNRLSWQFLWGDGTIIRTYYSLANAGLLAIITGYVWGLISLRIQKQSILADEVLPGDGQACDWVIRSCRPKPDWQRFLTIRYHDKFYQPFKEDIGPKPRPFVYYLRKPPSGHLINVIRDFNPEDVRKTRN